VLGLQKLVQQLQVTSLLQSASKVRKDPGGLAMRRLAQTSAGIMPVISLLFKVATSVMRGIQDSDRNVNVRGMRNSLKIQEVN
jgi:hypothetical protein